MFHHRYGAILGLLGFVLIAASGLWGLLTYRLPAVTFPLLGQLSDRLTQWRVLLMLAVGLGVGWVVMRYVMRCQEPRGRVWSVLMAGAFGAWLGGMILGKWGWIWPGVNPIGSLIIAFGLAWGVGQSLGRSGGNRRGSS